MRGARHIALLLLVAMSGPGAAQDVSSGQALFERFCATCHGDDARGNGPTAAVVLVPPTDLTKLTANARGTFPMARVVRRIDGRDTLIAHGSPMPIYGAFFEGDETVRLDTDEGVLEVSRPVFEIVAYLRSLQR